MAILTEVPSLSCEKLLEQPSNKWYLKLRQSRKEFHYLLERMLQ